jgi:hypothetical protein
MMRSCVVTLESFRGILAAGGGVSDSMTHMSAPVLLTSCSGGKWLFSTPHVAGSGSPMYPLMGLELDVLACVVLQFEGS